MDAFGEIGRLRGDLLRMYQCEVIRMVVDGDVFTYEYTGRDLVVTYLK